MSVGAPVSPEPAASVLIFDGACNLCNATVNFIIDHDRAGRFRFASNASEAGQALLRGCGLPADAVETVVLVEPDGRCYTKSAAALRVARALGWPWRFAYAGAVIPRPVRDRVYDWVARNRYRWFGKRESCRMPTPELQGRFL